MQRFPCLAWEIGQRSGAHRLGQVVHRVFFEPTGGKYCFESATAIGCGRQSAKPAWIFGASETASRFRVDPPGAGCAAAEM